MFTAEVMWLVKQDLHNNRTAFEIHNRKIFVAVVVVSAVVAFVPITYYKLFQIGSFAVYCGADLRFDDRFPQLVDLVWLIYLIPVIMAVVQTV